MFPSLPPFRSLASALTLALALAAALPAPAAEATPLAAAQALARSGKTAEAQAAFEAILKQDPKSADAAITLTGLLFQRNEEDKAVEVMEKATKASPAHAEAFRVLGDAYGRAAVKAGVLSKFGLAKKCLAAYQRSAELDPKNVATHQSLYEYYRQAPGFVGGGDDKAAASLATIEKLAREIKATEPDRARPILAQVYTAQKKYDLAFGEFEEVLKTTPDHYNAHFQIGRLAAITEQQLDRGLAALKRCLELTPPPNTPSHAAAHWRIGNILEKKKDVAGARAAYEAALKLDPKFTNAIEALKKLK